MAIANTWTRIAGTWSIKAPTGKPGDRVSVYNRAGVETKAILGEELLPANPGVFRYIKMPPTEISDAMVESPVWEGQWPAYYSYFLVDGKKFSHMGCCEPIWMGTAASGNYEIEFACSVLADTFYVCLKKDGRYCRDPHYCGVKGFDEAVKTVRRMWENN